MQRHPPGFVRGGLCTSPGLCSLQRRITRPGLKRNIDRALIELGIIGFACSVKNERIARSRLTALYVQFAQQELVEKRCVKR